MKLSIVIPIYNEEKTLRELINVVEQLKLPVEKEIIMVNDGSKDRSWEILETYKDKHIVINSQPNQGKGAAIREGLKHTTGDFVVIQDADLEYDPHEFVRLLEPLMRDEADVVYGSRFLSGTNTSRYSTYAFGNKFLSFLTSILYFKRITDMETCYKMFKKKVVDSFTITRNRFDMEPEITAKVLKQGWRLKEVPITYEGRTKEEGKKIGPKDGLIAVWVLLKYRFLN